jgi:hypothetical protein
LCSAYADRIDFTSSGSYEGAMSASKTLLSRLDRYGI